MSRKIHLLAAAMEALDTGEPPVIDLADHELAMALVSNEQMSADISRAFDQRDGLVTLAGLVTGMESAIVNVGLVRCAVNLSLAGTRFVANDMVPSLESTNDLTTSAETISETAKAIFDRIVAAVKKALIRIREFFITIAGGVGRTQRMNVAIANRAKGKNGRNYEYTITLRMERHRLETMNKLPQGAGEILRGLKELKRQVDVSVTQFSGMVESAGAGIADAIHSDASVSSTYRGKVDSAFAKIDFKALGSLLNVRLHNDPRFAKDEMKVAPALMGNKSIFINDHGNGDSITRTAQLADSIVTASRNSAGSETSYDTIAAADMLGLTGEIDGILKVLQAHNENIVKKLTEKNTAILNASVASQANISRAQSTSEDNANYSAVDRVSNAYYKAANTLQSQICNHALLVCKAVLSVCNLSLDQHK